MGPFLTLDEEATSLFSRKPKEEMKLKKKKSIFVACEGESEQAYVALLNELAQEKDPPLPVFLRSYNVKGGGPCKMVAEAIKKVSKGDYTWKEKVILMDKDVCKNNPDECQKAKEKAKENGFLILWQEPNHEGFLLQHLCDEKGNLSLTAENAQDMLKRKLDLREYKKPLTRYELRSRIGAKEIERAAKKIKNLGELLEWMYWPLPK